MASKSSKTDSSPDWTGPRIDFASFSAKLAARRAELGDAIAAPRNSGERRTASKTALLKAIDDAGGRW